MDLNLSVFQEPRGVMRILQFVFSICAFATTAGYSGFVNFECVKSFTFTYDYPFYLELIQQKLINSNNESCTAYVTINAQFSSDAKFFVATGVLAMLYSLIITVVYIKFDALYKNNNQVPLVDFVLSVVFAVLWLSSSAAWANGLNGLKYATDTNIIWKIDETPTCHKCPVSVSNFSTLNISVILGFLNFFLWASDLWFLYKETTWFQNAPPSTTDGI